MKNWLKFDINHKFIMVWQKIKAWAEDVVGTPAFGRGRDRCLKVPVEHPI